MFDILLVMLDIGVVMEVHQTLNVILLRQNHVLELLPLLSIAFSEL